MTDKPKRVPNAYMMFCKKTRPEIAKENPDITFVDTGKKLGEMWRALTDDEKKNYANK